MGGDPPPGPALAGANRLGAHRHPSGSSSSSTALPAAPGVAATPAAARPVAALNPQAGPAAAAARHEALLIIGALLHLVLAVHQWRSEEAGLPHAVALALATLVPVAGSFLLARFCLRHRTVVLTFSRIALFASPAWGKALPPLLLDRAAQPGPLGYIRDAAHVLTGTRLLLIVVGGAAVPLPPAATLAVQLLLLQLSSPAQLCCTAQHLAAPHIAFLRTMRNSIASWARKGTTAADATVHALLGSCTGSCSRAATAYWVVSLCWVFCKRLAGIYAIC